MPHFFFDISIDGKEVRDPEGSDLIDVTAARREAMETLVQMARDVFRSRDHGGTISIVIRDENGAALRTLRLIIAAEDHS